MRPLVQALCCAISASVLPTILPAGGRAATGEVTAPLLPELQRVEEDIGLSPMPIYHPPAPRFERQAAFIGLRTGHEEHDTYGYTVVAEDSPPMAGAAR